MNKNSDNHCLDEYNQKRDFFITGEPEGQISHFSKQPFFVIQKHQATRLHYDFRIAHAGVLLSWAVPKGPSMDPFEKRLAIQTEDHPMDYADFEGVIPKGQYGAGEVIVWDQGLYHNLSTKDGQQVDLDTALEKGHITIVIAGQKCKGGFSLIRIDNDKKSQWLLVKSKDPYAQPGSDITKERPESVITGRNISDL